MSDIVLSPFLPNTSIQYAWDSTSLGMLKTCPQLYKYTMLDGWTPKEDSVHLRFGIEYHKALEEYDAERFDGKTHEDSVRQVVHNLLCRIADWNPNTDTKAGNYKNPRTLLQLVIDYLDRYQIDPAQTAVRKNGRPATELSFRFELDWGPTKDHNDDVMRQPYILCGHLDRVVNFNDETFVMDRKTTTTTPSQYFFDQFSPNNQMTIYTIAGQVILEATIRGVIIDSAQVLLEKPNNFVRGFTYRTQAQLDEWLQDLRFWLNQAENYATVGYWPKNDTACDKFGGCKFRGVCSRDPSVRERFLEADFNKLPLEDRWNPLKPR